VQWLKVGEGAYEDQPRPRPWVMLLDIKMPKVDGIEVLRRIKTDGRTRSIPVVMLTSGKEETDLDIAGLR
jgi:two-component system, response regulator